MSDDPPGMTAHQLARILLAGPDRPVYATEAGYDGEWPVDTVNLDVDGDVVLS